MTVVPKLTKFEYLHWSEAGIDYVEQNNFCVS